MDKTKKKKIAAFAASAAVFSLMTAGAVMLARSLLPAAGTAEVFSQSSAAVITPRVIDGDTGEPVAGAVIVIPEADMTCTTDENGSAGALDMPVNTDGRFRDILPQPWGEVSVLVYADGYTPCAVFGYMVAQGETRDGPLVMLFDEDGSENAYSLIEPPHREWVDAIVEKYRP